MPPMSQWQSLYGSLTTTSGTHDVFFPCSTCVCIPEWLSAVQIVKEQQLKTLTIINYIHSIAFVLLSIISDRKKNPSDLSSLTNPMECLKMHTQFKFKFKFIFKKPHIYLESNKKCTNLQITQANLGRQYTHSHGVFSGTVNSLFYVSLFTFHMFKGDYILNFVTKLSMFI